LKILHVGYSDTKGGAAIAMMRLHVAMLDSNIDSHVLVTEKLSSIKNVYGPQNSFEILLSEIKKIVVRQKKYFFKSKNYNTHSLNIFNSNIVDKINKINPDIVNLHWINNEMVSIKQISKIKKPIVWTINDMWPICGSEHYSYSKRFMEGYFKNNREKNESGIDLNRWTWMRKKKHWNNKFSTIVCISEWLKNQTLKSNLFKDCKVTTINCPIDNRQWKKIDKHQSREILDLPKNKKILLFVSNNGTKDERKGFEYVDGALNELIKKKDNLLLLIIGKSDLDLKKKYDFKVIDKIFNGNPIELRLFYSACDILLAPSKLEAFGQVALEASSCGTPTIAFNDTGFKDIIEHNKNGYLVKYGNQEDFTFGLNHILDNLENEEMEIKNNCIRVSNKFSNDKIVNNYIKIYKEIFKV